MIPCWMISFVDKVFSVLATQIIPQDISVFLIHSKVTFNMADTVLPHKHIMRFNKH